MDGDQAAGRGFILAICAFLPYRDAPHHLTGDEKQSIYSFQEARLNCLRRSEETEKGSGSDQPFHVICLPLSFRSTADVLAVADQASLEVTMRKAFSGDRDLVQHCSNRIGHPGAVDLWDVVPEISEQEEDRPRPSI